MINKLFILFLANILNAQVIRDDQNNVIFDTASKLMWQDDNRAIFNYYTWENAINFCENLNFAGHEDWRLPNINEFYTVVDFTKSNPVINNRFKNIKSLKYWSNTSYKYDLSQAWFIDFTNGSSSYQSKILTTTLTRCVRDIN